MASLIPLHEIFTLTPGATLSRIAASSLQEESTEAFVLKIGNIAPYAIRSPFDKLTVQPDSLKKSPGYLLQRDDVIIPLKIADNQFRAGLNQSDTKDIIPNPVIVNNNCGILRSKPEVNFSSIALAILLNSRLTRLSECVRSLTTRSIATLNSNPTPLT